MDALDQANIYRSIRFVYDDVPFDYIVVWYSIVAHKTYYQLFYDLESAKQFYTILSNRSKLPEMYVWSHSQYIKSK